MRRRLRGVWPALVGAAFLGGMVVAAMTLLPSMHAVNDGLTCMSTSDCSTLAAQRSAAAAAWATAGIAFISTVVGSIGIWLVYATLAATRKSVRVALRGAKAAEDAIAETRRIGEAQVRAYLSCTGMMYDPSSNSDPQFVVYLKNTGQSPALQLQVQIQSLFVWQGGNKTVRRAGHIDEVAAQTEDQVNITLATNLTELMEIGSVRVQADLEISYIDVFGERDTLNARYKTDMGTLRASSGMMRLSTFKSERQAQRAARS